MTTVLTITTTYRLDAIADAAIGREHETWHYDLNIRNYERVLARLPSEWPPDLMQFRGLTREELAARCPVDRHALAVDLTIRDQLYNAIRVEQHAKRIVEVIYEALVDQLPPDRAADLLHAASVRLEAKRAQAERVGGTLNVLIASPEQISEQVAQKVIEARSIQ